MSVFSRLRVQPSQQLRRRRGFYVLYDGFYLVLCSGLIALMLTLEWPGLWSEYSWWLLLALPAACHLVTICHVFVHNCTHSNFPRAINRLVGELCGLVVLSRYASWEIIHRRHHKYSDDPVRDPHPVVPSYWRYVWNTLVNVERQLQQQFVEWHGDTERNRRFERGRALLSYGTNFALIGAWYLFLGPAAFWVLFVPASVWGILHLIHFNWSTHNAHHPEQGFFPINLDHGYYWAGNRIWFGIYFHKNHHDFAGVFNPRFLDAARSREMRAA